MAKSTASKFVRVPSMQFIAALGDPKASSGTGASNWGIWRIDPGPRGVYLSDWELLKSKNGKSPAGWTFDQNDWWLEEHGLIMEKPNFPLPVGRYFVTGGRATQSILTVHEDGDRWELSDGAKLHDVTHLPCRSARYQPLSETSSPGNANTSHFPVKPGGDMPAVEGCKKQDYWVIFVTAIESSELVKTC